MEEQLKTLKQVIVAKYPDAQFEPRIALKDIKAFETTSGLNLPQELITLYTWHNGVQIHPELCIPSLDEAYALFVTHLQNTISQPSIKDLNPKTLEEVEKILSPVQKEDIGHVAYEQVWLPVYNKHRSLHQSTVHFSYLIPKTGSFLKRSSVNDVGSYENSLDLSSFQEYDCFIFRSLPDIINSLMEEINPPKKSFFRTMKHYINLAGQLLDGY